MAEHDMSGQTFPCPIPPRLSPWWDLMIAIPVLCYPVIMILSYMGCN